MKKTIILSAVLSGVLIQPYVYADAFDSFVQMQETSAVICGRAKGYGTEDVTLLLIHNDNGSIGYAAQTQTDEDGYYKFSFEFTENTSDYKVIVNRADELINDTITNASIQRSFYADINLDFDGSKSRITAFTEKCFENADNDAVLLLAQYDENNRLINLSKTEFEAIAGGNTESIIKAAEKSTKYIKGYLWSELSVMQPIEENVTYEPLTVSEKGNLSETDEVVISCLGDSITWGYGTTKQYHSYIADRINSRINNMGISGTTVTDAVSNPFIERVRKIPENSDLIIVLGGVNDRNANAPLGKLGDNGQETFYGAYDSLLKAIRRNCPRAKLVAVTPLNSPDTWQSQISIEEYANSVIAVANANYVPVLDVYHELDLSDYFPDALHPDETGHELLAEYIIDKLVSKEIIEFR